MVIHIFKQRQKIDFKKKTRLLSKGKDRSQKVIIVLSELKSVSGKFPYNEFECLIDSVTVFCGAVEAVVLSLVQLETSAVDRQTQDKLFLRRTCNK